MESASTIVIKVKYGDMLRRLNARIIGGELDLTLDWLKGKITSLFSIAPDAELILTYIDEDGDVVHLVDGDDLQDVVKQGLNPVRITARLNSQLNAGQQPLDNLQAGVTEALKAVPEPFRETLVNLSADLSQTLKTSPPLIVEIVDTFSKVGLSYLGQSSNSQTTAQPSKINEPDNSSLSKDKDAVKVNIVKPVKAKFLPTGGEEQAVNSSESLKNTQLEVNNLKPSKAKFLSAGGQEQAVNSSESLKNARLEEEKESDGLELQNASRRGEDKLPLRPHRLKWASQGPRRACTRKPNLRSVKELLGDLKKPSSCHPVRHSGPSPTHGCPISGISDGGKLSYSSLCPPVFHSGVRCDGCGIYPITGPRFKAKVKFDYDLCIICFGKIGNSIEYTRMDHPAVYQDRVVYRHLDSLNGLCNSAKTQPHEPRPSKLDSCFIDDVNVFDGTVMAPSTPFTKIWRLWNNGTAEWPQGTQLVCIGGDLLRTSLSIELEIPKSGVPVGQVFDVAVEFVAPEFPDRYISYWRMLSPSGKQFGQRVWVLIEVDASLPKSPPVKKSELNLFLPTVSCSPIGSTGINLDPVPIAGSTQLQAEKNKETVEPEVETQPQGENNKRTVEIVEPVVEMQLQSEYNKRTLDIVDPVVEVQPQPESNKKNVEMVEPVVEVQPQTANHKKTVVIVEPVVEMQPLTKIKMNFPINDKLVEPVGEAQPHKSQEMNFPINDNLLVGNGASSPLVTDPSYPFLFQANNLQPPPVTGSGSGALNSGLSVPDPTGIVIDSPPPLASVSSAQESYLELPGKMEVEEKLLKELEEMGFKDVRSNREVLRMNEYDLEQAVDDLCHVAEWDPMLEELEEMGFCDTEMNKQLLEKNNGSIMRVVMDLIAGEDKA